MKQGNQHSSLLDTLTKVASAQGEKKETSTFASQLIKTLQTEKKEQTLAGMMGDMASGVTDMVGGAASAVGDVASGIGQGVGNAIAPVMDAGKSMDMDEDPLAGEELESTDPELGGDTSSAVQSLVDALIALKGGSEEAHAAIDECCGGDSTGEDIEPLDEDIEPLDEDIEPLGEEMDPLSPENGIESEPIDMAPMEMPM